MFDGNAAPQGDLVAVELFHPGQFHIRGGLNGLIGVIADLDKIVQQTPDIAATMFHDLLTIGGFDVADPLLVGVKIKIAKHGGTDKGAGLVGEIMSPEYGIGLGVDPLFIRPFEQVGVELYRFADQLRVFHQRDHALFHAARQNDADLSS